MQGISNISFPKITANLAVWHFFLIDEFKIEIRESHHQRKAVFLYITCVCVCAYVIYTKIDFYNKASFIPFL